MLTVAAVCLSLRQNSYSLDTENMQALLSDDWRAIDFLPLWCHRLGADTKKSFHSRIAVLCEVNFYHPDCQLTAVTVTEEEKRILSRSHRCDYQCFSATEQQHEDESHARTRGHTAKQTQNKKEMKDLMQMVSQSDE